MYVGVDVLVFKRERGTDRARGTDRQRGDRENGGGGGGVG